MGSIAFLLLLAGPAHADRPAPAAMIDSWIVPRLQGDGRGFQAEVESVWTTTYGPEPTVEVDKQRFFLDSEGRSRVEWGLGEAPVAIVFDPVRNAGAFFDLETAEVFYRLPIPSDDPSSEPDPKAGRPTIRPGDLSRLPFEDLGVRSIEGLRCRGFRDRVELGRLDGPGRDERLGVEQFTVVAWVAEELGQVILETRVSQHEHFSLRAHGIRFGQPERALFVVPGN